MKKTQGIALVTVLIIMTVVVTLVMTASLLSLSNRRSSVDNFSVVETQYVAEAGIEVAIDRMFYQTRRNFALLKANSQGPSSTTTFDACTFKFILTGVIGVDSAVATPNNNNQNGGCPYLWNTDLAKKGSSTRIVTPPMPNLYSGATQTITGTLNGMGYSVAITRTDTPEGNINLSIESTSKKMNGTAEVAVRVVRRNLQITGAPYPGDRFAMLTNNANCSFCHLQVDTMRRAYSTSTTEQFDGAYMGSAGPNLAFENGGHYADSIIAGTVITRGTSRPPTNAGDANVAGDGTYSAKWGSVPGKVKGGSIASILGDRFSTTQDTTSTAGCTSALPKGNDANDAVASALNAFCNPIVANAKMYYNYPNSESVKAAPYNTKYPDVELPDAFPLVVPDSNNNKLVDDSEWNLFTTSTAGGGTLTGGVMFGVSRPSSNIPPANNNVPISYDPISSNATLYGTTPAALPNQLAPALTQLANNTFTGGATAFVAAWRGWLLQQALASPNNRDYLPTNPTFLATNPAGASSVAVQNVTVQATATNAGNVQFTTALAAAPNFNAIRCTNGYQSQIIAGSTTAQVNVTPVNQAIPVNTTCTLYTFVPIFWPTNDAAGLTNGAAPNNFWVTYNPAGTGTITLRYCITANCAYTNASGSRTSNNGALAANTFAALTIPDVNSVWFPSGSNGASGSLGSTGRFDGNLILDGGRVANNVDGGIPAQALRTPLQINGTISVNGDLVIRGRIAGTGRIVVRGNIFVVGDLIYDCGNKACSTAEYANPDENLPKLALLAGGAMTIGDYDAPDFRTNFRQSDLTNDQTYQFRNPSATVADRTSGSSISSQTPYLYYNIPGATGMNRNNNFSENGNATGFIGRLISTPNSRNTERYFASAPFGLINNCSDTSAYSPGTNNCFINSVTPSGGTALSIISLYPSNGPITLGSAATIAGVTRNGMFQNPTAATSPMATNVGCETRAFNQALDPTLPPVGIGSGVWNNVYPTTTANIGSPWRSSFSFSFWCSPANTNGQLRNGQRINVNANQSPVTDTSAWFAQPAQNAALDANVGMTTGWLGGLLGRNLAPVTTPTAAAVGQFTQIGDLSQTRLLKLMWLATMEDGTRDADPRDATSNDPRGPLRTDGIFYSPHGIFALARYYAEQNGGVESSTQSRWIHNGSVIASELGFLLTGNVTKSAKQFTTNKSDAVDFSPATTGGFKGPGMGILYDDRLVGLLGIGNTGTVQLNRTGSFVQVSR